MNMCYLRKGKTLIVFLKCDTVKSVIYGSPLGATTHIYIYISLNAVDKFQISYKESVLWDSFLYLDGSLNLFVNANMSSSLIPTMIL